MILANINLCRRLSIYVSICIYVLHGSVDEKGGPEVKRVTAGILRCVCVCLVVG